MGSSQRIPLPHSRLHHPLLHQIQHHSHKKTQSTQLADKLGDIMSNPLLIAPLKKAETATASCQSYVYTAPCEHHPSKGQTDYLVNDMFPKLKHDLSTIEFGIRIADFMPLAFKTVPVAGLVEKELQLLHDLSDLPNVIQLQDSFVNDNGDTVLVLPMLKKFDCDIVNKTLCSIRKTTRQILTGLASVHAKDIVHLDINPSNLMVTHAKKDVVIIDFGLSSKVDRKNLKPQVPACGTIGYIAPEVLRPQNYGEYDPTLADLYSLGIVLGQMLAPYIPDCDLHYFGSKYLSVENTNQTVAYLKEFIQETHYPSVLTQAADLLRCMLEENPNNRRSAQDLLDTHPFLTTCPETSPSSTTLKLCDWLCRVQEIKYQKYLIEEQKGCEIYRYR
ncbi:Calcium/calmodulin-dependent protein kinase type IV [Haplosporangium sp. Z 27]|nr:Calcium/calmodulin-dependent protein kinase type IV [Haplosporangium sp. Z 27]